MGLSTVLKIMIMSVQLAHDLKHVCFTPVIKTFRPENKTNMKIMQTWLDRTCSWTVNEKKTI